MNNKKLKLNRGLSTLEILLAFAILILAITAVLQMGFGNQSITVDAETNTEAINKAQQLLEDARARARSDYFSLVSSNSSETSGPLSYTKNLIIDDLTPCKKQATSTVTWDLSPVRTLKVELGTFLTDIPGVLALGGDCATMPPTGNDWKKPQDLSYTGVSLKTDGFGKGIDAKDNITYLITKAAGNNKDDFYIFETSNINSPVKHGHLDIADGLEDIDIAGNFAFIASDENKATQQLVVVDISDIDTPQVVASTTLTGVSGNCPITCPGGRSIYYYNNKVYIGTHRLTAGGAAEFHIFNVTDPTNPQFLGSKGGTALGDVTDHNINDIYVRDQTVNGVKYTYAFLATSNNNGELTILNVTNPASIPNPANTPATGAVLNLPGSGTGENLDGLSIFVIGNKAYIGRERATGSSKDFYIVDISNPGNPSILGSLNLGLNSNGSAVVGAVGIKVASRLALVATSDPNKPFVVLDISNTSNITRWDLVACNINYSTYATSMDYDNNQIYLSLHNATSNINLIIIKSNGGSC